MLSQATTQLYLTFNAEHGKLLDFLTTKMGKDRSQIITTAIELALSRGLPPARYKWVDKNHRVLSVQLPAEIAQKARTRWGRRLSPIAVSGMLEIERSKRVSVLPSEIQEAGDVIRELREELAKITQKLRIISNKISTEEVPHINATNGTAAARAVKVTLGRLIEQLAFFKKGDEEDRRRFREQLDPVEIGYVTSLFKALFDEEGFQRWVLASDFAMGGTK